MFQHAGIESGDFLGSLTQRHSTTVIVEPHVRWQTLVRLGEHWALMFQSSPLHPFLTRFLLPPGTSSSTSSSGVSSQSRSTTGVWVLARSQSVYFRLNDCHHHQGCGVGVRVSPESGFWPGVKVSLLDLMTAIIIRDVKSESESPRSLGDGLESKCLF